MSIENEFDNDFDFVDHYGSEEAAASEELLPENEAISAINCGFVGVGGGGGKLAKAFIDLGFNKTKEWPLYDKSFLEKQNISFVIQINGKKRGLLNVKKDINENELLEMIKIDKTMSKYFNVSDIKRVIFVKNRLINILLNG